MLNIALIHCLGSSIMHLSTTAVAVFVGSILATPAAYAKVQVEELLRSQTSWDGTAYTTYPAGRPEMTLIKITIPAQTSLDWHTHPMPNVGYVLSGELTVEAKDPPLKRTLRPGDALAEMVGLPHRGSTGELPVELIVFYAGAEGLPLSE